MSLHCGIVSIVSSFHGGGAGGRLGGWGFGGWKKLLTTLKITLVKIFTNKGQDNQSGRMYSVAKASTCVVLFNLSVE